MIAQTISARLKTLMETADHYLVGLWEKSGWADREELLAAVARDGADAVEETRYEEYDGGETYAYGGEEIPPEHAWFANLYRDACEVVKYDTPVTPDFRHKIKELFEGNSGFDGWVRMVYDKERWEECEYEEFRARYAATAISPFEMNPSEEAWEILALYHECCSPESHTPNWGKKETQENTMNPTNTPTIVCLCGSTRFSQAFQGANLRETIAGKIVLTIGCDMKSDHELFASMTPAERDELKARLDKLHFCKIDLAHEVLILNVGGYIGESTRRELEYARQLGKVVRFLEPETNLPTAP